MIVHRYLSRNVILEILEWMRSDEVSIQHMIPEPGNNVSAYCYHNYMEEGEQKELKCGTLSEKRYRV